MTKIYREIDFKMRATKKIQSKVFIHIIIIDIIIIITTTVIIIIIIIIIII